MINFILLTADDGTKYYVNIYDITNINDVFDSNIKSRVVTYGDVIYVKESCEEIFSKINEIYNAHLIPAKPYHMYDYRPTPYRDNITCSYNETKETNNEQTKSS
jgi:uncharacterized protein YlzI (FlbEa/FlbD family)